MSLEHTSTTYWHCEECGCVGSISHTQNAGVYEVVNILDDAHKAEHRLMRVGCRRDLVRVRVSKTPFKFNVAKNRWESSEEIRS